MPLLKDAMKTDTAHARAPSAPIGETLATATESKIAHAPESTPDTNDGSPSPFVDSGQELPHATRSRELGRGAFEYSPPAGDASFEITQTRKGGFVARCTLALVSVSSTALASEQVRWTESGRITPGEAARQRALISLACSLQPNQRLHFIHATEEQADRTLRYRMFIECIAMACDSASALGQALALLEALRPTLAVGVDQFRFEQQPSARRCGPTRWLDRVELVPAAISISQGPEPSMAYTESTARPQALLPLVPTHTQTFMEDVVPALASLHTETQLVLEWRGLRLDAAAMAVAVQDVERLLNATSRFVRFANLGGAAGEVPPEELRRAHGVLQGWVADPVGACMRVWIQSAGQVPLSLARLFGQEVYLGRPFSIRRTADVRAMPDVDPVPAVDLSGLVARNMPVPPLFPEPIAMDTQGVRRHFPALEFDRPVCGIVLGESLSRNSYQDIRFADLDRGQHCYVPGTSGGGKTYQLVSMAQQDIKRGAGVCFIDPAGDAYEHLLATCPPERWQDLVLLDFTDFEASPGLNLLQFQTQWPRVERGFIVDNLVQIFKHQYPDVPEGFGPMFELYFTNAAYLAMEMIGSTVLDIVRVFADPAFRRGQLAICRDPRVKEFWTNIALRAGGDASLENMAPYIVSKLTKMLHDEVVTRVVGQSESTIDFRACMDQQAVVLVKLPKGFSEAGAQFLGMLLTTRLFGAALSRADVAPAERVPFHVYMDECQNLISPTIAGMLAESRKFGLRLHLANQTLAQMPQSLMESVLANCSTKIIMRTGPQDAELLASWVAPHFCAADLVALPNRHAVARVMCNGVLSPPFALRTRTLPDVQRSPQLDAQVAAIRAESRRRYCVAANVIEERIAARRAPLPEAAAKAGNTDWPKR